MSTVLVDTEEPALVYLYDAEVGKERLPPILTGIQGRENSAVGAFSQKLVPLVAIKSRLAAYGMVGYVLTSGLDPGHYASLLSVEGMTCRSCVKLIEDTVAKMEGVRGIKVSLKRCEAFVHFDHPRLKANDIAAAIYDLGFSSAVISTYCTNPSGSRVTQKSTKGRGHSETAVIAVEGMVCKSCVNNIEGNVGKMNGVASVKVSLEEKRAVIEYESSKVSPQELCTAIEDLGFEAKMSNEAKDSFGQEVVPKKTIRVVNIGIEGMTCHSCVGLIESTLRDLAGVLHVTVSLAKKHGIVEYDEGMLTAEDLKGAIGAMGFIVTYITGKLRGGHGR